MHVQRRYEYRYRQLDAGELATAYEKAIRAIGEDPSVAKFHVGEYLPDGTYTSRHINITELERLCGKESTSYRKYANEKEIAISFLQRGQLFLLSIESESTKTLSLVEGEFNSVLHLEPPPIEDETPNLYEEQAQKFTSALQPILNRIEQLENTSKPASRRLRCFLSFRFSEKDELVALRIQQYLALLNVDVITGATYEPRQVTEKVLSRLREPLDFILLLVTSEGESMWTRDEIGAAVHQNIALVPLVEKGTKLQAGLFGDIEYIEFAPGHIGDAFLKLLQAIHFLREQSSEAPSQA